MSSEVKTRVVVAEDEAIIRLDLVEILAEAGYEVVGDTGRGDEALELVSTLAPDVAVLDVKMPGLDGLSAAAELYERHACAVVLVTAFSQREMVEAARESGVGAYVVKPFQPSDLIPAIEIALGRHAERLALRDSVGTLEARLAARTTIDRAKGILMDQHAMSEADAYRFLRQNAMDSRVSMEDVARSVVEGTVAPQPDLPD